MRAALRDSELLIGRAVGQIFHRENKTESYVEIPPALIITAPNGVTFTLGVKYRQGRSPIEAEYNVAVNDVDTGQYASRIVMRAGIIKIFGREGWRTWSERSRNFL